MTALAIQMSLQPPAIVMKKKQFTKTEKQTIATRLQAAYLNVLLVGGSRSGKTFITLRNILIRACAVLSRHVMFRFKFNAIKRSVVYDTLPAVWNICGFKDMLGPLSKFLNKSDLFIELPNGSQIWFGGLDDKERTEKILGTEYSTLYFNESSQIPYDSVVLALTRLSENSGLDLVAYYDCNPPTKKHWTFQQFITGVVPGTHEKIKNHEAEYAVLVMNPDDNRKNLPTSYFDRLDALPRKQRDRFRDGLFSEDTEGAHWNSDMIDQALSKPEPDILIRTVIGVDPAITNEDKSDLWGIVAASIYHGNVINVDGKDVERFQGYVHTDYSLKASPQTSVLVAIKAYHTHDADAIVVEVNQGGDMVVDLLRLNGFKGKIIKVNASRGKFARAEPVAALYEQGLIGHNSGLNHLEDELTTFTPFDPKTKKSPDRLDAFVWAMTALFLGKTQFEWNLL